ncbi:MULTISPECIES: phage head closure protein [Chelativorans]|jgi:SPP1 family predicted phage head-tail adaptor|uniref:Phage head-tail adaptor, putative n=1 Tax=Chelativorans sp. (strain BNC1) TaxID=266779 RepID=Q11H46_CHESB|nr:MULTISPECIES: phage head closure protein [Chelativorans]
MRAGKLDRTITIQRFTETYDEVGTPVQEWADLATVRAQIIQVTTEEFTRGWGASSEAAIVFRIRHINGLTLADRVSYGGKTYDLKEVKEIGRRRGLDLRATAAEG